MLMNFPLSQVRGFPDLGRALGHLTAFMETLSAAGVTPLEYHAMLLLKTCPGERITVGGLARGLSLPRSFSGSLADRLVENDFVLRRLSVRPQDSIVQLSPHGGEVLAGLASRHLEELHALEEVLAVAASPSCGS
jgi:DNA-binding MarR family transcriptional regulator